MDEPGAARPAQRRDQHADGIGVSMTTLVPPRRLGELLRSARESAGLSVVDLADRIETHDIEDLAAFEAGRHPLDDDDLREVLALYGINENDVPSRSRLIIDVDESSISMGDDLSVAFGGSPDDVLARYLAVVYKVRGIELGVPIPLRDLDIDVLSSALELKPHRVEVSLRKMMSADEPVHAESRWLRRRMLVPLAGVIVAATAVGVLIFVGDDSSPEISPRIGTPAIVEAPPASVDIGTPGIVEAPPVSVDIGTPAVVDAVETSEPEILDAIITNDDGEVVVRE